MHITNQIKSQSTHPFSGSDVVQHIPRRVISCSGSTEEQPQLIISSLDRDYSQTEKLLKKGLDPNIASSVGGFTGYLFGNYSPLLIAVLHQDLELVELLLKYGANPDQPHFFGKSPLGWAKQSCNKKIIAILESPPQQPFMQKIYSIFGNLFRLENN